MATTTGSSHETQSEQGPVEATSKYSLHGWLLILLVFIAGAASLSLEMTASRLLAPYFGTSLFVWASLIGLILLYLTVGYYVGGQVSDRTPKPILLYSVTAIAALFIAVIPLIADPILSWSLSAFTPEGLGVFYGSLVSIILLFAIPTILLGCVSPFAIRLRVQQVGSSGRVAGMLYALSTAGSILGTFLPVLVLMPDMGTRLTFLTTGATLLLISLVGLIVSNGLNKSASGSVKG